jgi:hypothetical protein
VTDEEHIAEKEKILDRIRELLGEHFESYLLVVETDLPEDDNATQTLVHYGGGFNTAWGLAMRAQTRFQLELQGEMKDAS